MNDLYETLSHKARTYKLLYHYTSIHALEIILKNKSLRLSRLDIVNDPKENQRITSLWNNKVFAACFTNTISNEAYFFENYGNVRISFFNDFCASCPFFDSKLTRKLLNFKTDCNSRSNMNIHSYIREDDWCMYDTSLADIYYTDNLESHIAKDGFESNAGLIKSKIGFDRNGVLRDWSIEEECRLRVAVRPIGFEAVREELFFRYPQPPFEYLFIPINNNILKIELFKGSSGIERERFDAIVSRHYH